MSYLPELRSSLMRAAERATEQHASTPARRWWRAAIRALPVALGMAVAVAVVVLALTQVGHHATTRRSAPATTQVRGRQALLNVLGVLRRPQTAADLHSRALTPYLRGPATQLGASPGTPDYPLIRRARTTPWGSPVFLVPLRPVSPKVPRGWTGYAPLSRSPAERLIMVDRSGAGGDATASDIEAGRLFSIEGAGRSFAGGSTQTRLIVVVPDGVTRVAFVLPRQVSRTDPTAPVYRRALTADAGVSGNVAAVQVARQSGYGPPPMIWYAADGHVIKRIGDLSAANRTVTTPKPGPETPQSRAAERNPSTPNHVWVTPARGGPEANYSVHFRVLLTDADYAFTFTGPKCRGLSLPGGMGGGASDVRGHIFTAAVGGPPRTGWCPGTYRVSVAVMDLGRAGNLKHPARPFGSATFTVRR